MRTLVFQLAILFLAVSRFSAQGILRGKIADDQGEAVVGALVVLSDSRTTAAFSDFEGNYSLTIKDSLSHLVKVSYVGYKEETFQIPALKNKKVIVRDFTLLASNFLVEVEVTAKQVKANDNYMENLKMKSATTIDYISNETMKKTGDPNVVAAVARVSGVSTSGGLITVRGIGDRYVKTTLNGLRIPTLDPLTNNIKLDIFPSSLIDNITITKTASPDLPGDFSAAYISIDTKDYPENLIVNCEFQVGYNQQTSFKNILSTEKSATDWLGYDNGFRDRTHGTLDKPNLTPSSYEEMKALGLGNYYASLGITGWADGSTEGTTYFKLGLVQLGLLTPAQFNDPTAITSARDAYNATYKPKAFTTLNPENTNYSNGFANNWNGVIRKAPLNFSQFYSVGNQTTLFRKKLGYIIGLRFANSVRYDENGYSKRLAAFYNGEYPLTTEDNAISSRETNGWNFLLNLAFKPNETNSISYLFMPNLSGTNDVQRFVTLPDTTSAQDGRSITNQFYEERKQFIHQLKSTHFFKRSKLKIENNFGYTIGQSKIPDFKVLEYGFVRNNNTQEVGQYLFGPTVGEGIRRYYRYLNENLFDGQISAELPVSTSTVGVRKFKAGIGYQQLDRTQQLYDYKVAYGNNVNAPVLTNSDINGIMGDEHFTMQNGVVDYFYQNVSAAWNNTFGFSKLLSTYLMTDYSITRSVRASGGMRVEYTDLFADVTKYHQLNLQSNDIRRENVGGFPYVNPASIKQVNFLPSLNVIFKTKEEKKLQYIYRVNYSRTLARPSIRELNDAAIYDAEFRTLIYGNSDLKIARVDNYDFRTDMYAKDGSNLSLSLFYKDFTNHIEASFGSGGISWNNVARSNAKGVELEFKKSFFKNFELRSNVTFVKSNSQVVRSILEVVDGQKVYTAIDTVNRPMYGQAPYIVNAILTYKNDSIGLIVTASYNVQGSRLVIAGVLKGFADVYEISRNLIDLKVSKTLGKRFTASVTVRDLLNAPVRRAYLLPSGYSDFDKFRYGTNYLLTLSYKFQ